MVYESTKRGAERVAQAIEIIDSGSQPRAIRTLLYSALAELNDVLFPGDQVYPAPAEPTNTKAA